MECIQYNHKQRFSVDRFKFIDMKYIDSKLSLIKYLHYYLAKMEFFFVWIRWFLFGFCSNQWLIFVVRIIKTHTMVVHFLGHSRPKRKKTEARLSWSFEACCQRLSLKVQFFSLLIFFDVACCVPPAHKLLILWSTEQNKCFYSPRKIGGVSWISLLFDRLFALASFFLSSSLFLFSKDLFNFSWLFEAQLWS